MGDFVNTGTTKSAVRDLASPIADMNSFTTIIQNILTNNPWSCTPYESGGESQPAIAKAREFYTGKVVYQNNEAKVIGQISVKAPTSAGFTSNVATIAADAALRTAMGGVPAHDSSEDKYTCSLRCHHADGEIYYVTFTRDKIRLSSYTSDAIATDLDTWADSVPALV